MQDLIMKKFTTPIECLRRAPWISLLLVFALVSPAAAAPRVLFVGNSFTRGATANVPAIFDALARAGGQEDPETVMRALGGKDFEFHATDASSQSAITSRQWDYVILQNYSTEPTHYVSSGHSLADHFTWGTVLYNQVIANNSGTQVILYQTWSRSEANSMITGVSSPTSFESTTEMQAELRENYAELARQLTEANPGNLPVWVAPCGDAWENAGGLLPASDPSFTDLHGDDEYHGNDNGYYLNAAVFYATIYKESPVGLHLDSAVTSLNLNLTEDATYLESVAWDAVVAAGLTDAELNFTTYPLSQTVSEFHDAVFTVGVTNVPNVQFQWFTDTGEVPGATGDSLTLRAVTAAMDGTSVYVRITDGETTLYSVPVTLTVEADVVAPSVTGAELDATGYVVTVSFSEKMEPTSASDPGAYEVLMGDVIIPVQQVTLSPSGDSAVLTLPVPVTDDCTVTLAGDVADNAGNTLAGNVATFSAPEVNGGLIYIDFGGVTTTGTTDGTHWNNVDSTMGSTEGSMLDLVYADGVASGASIAIVSRFGGANTNGTTASLLYPSAATSDSLYGNTEAFGGRTNVFPVFRLAGLSPSLEHTLTFYASRMGVTDIRESRYTITGATTEETVLNASSNVDGTTQVTLNPAADGTITVAIDPGPSNNNANHFTYMGVLVVDAPIPTQGRPTFKQFEVQAGAIHLDWEPSSAYLDSAPTPMGPWTLVTPVTAPPVEVALPAAGENVFYRLRVE